MKILEIVTEAKNKTSFKFTKLKKVKNTLVEATDIPKLKFEKYPDNKAGVIKFMKNPKEVKQTFTTSLDLPNCDIHADPQVVGVWAVDSMKTGSRVIVYLGGYKDPWGEIREGNDFEEGGFPLSMVKSLVRRGDVTRKQLVVWEKLGNLLPGDLVKLDKEFEDEEYYTGKARK